MSCGGDFRDLRRALSDVKKATRTIPPALPEVQAGAVAALSRCLALSEKLEASGAMTVAQAALEGVSDKLEFKRQEFKRQECVEALKDLGPLAILPGGEDRALSRIVLMTAHVAGLGGDDLRGPRRDQHVVRARYLGMLLAYVLTTAPRIRIGAAFGGRDQSTARNGISRAMARIETCDGTALLAAAVLDRLACDTAVGVA